MSESTVIAAADAFTNWAQPWAFYESTIAQPDLSASDRATIRDIWSEACNARHWQDASLQECSACAERALHVVFPWLPAQTRAQFVRAASYQWR
ncbi:MULTISPECIES: hypothetical protein [Paraburkholderia]|uniref:hypothetical protein n=1 Tax=Paraburkholderia TaxID=1822464 RepID=UPI002253B094|nr:MULTISPECIES: hypothetical protein [Paraburkholderia]MCX4162854.1 hypothetical protein [Paraburkholderia megapolitana]MDN7158349.1 hypothetical protein [Paraburkholderia sp. CHISQ3]MDQ6495396.1 hypothetical protein [Paraburkholderia megapolitana]